MIEFDGEKFLANTNNQKEKKYLSEAGFVSSGLNTFYCKDIKKVSRLRKHFSNSTKKFFSKYVVKKVKPWASTPISPKSKKLQPVQIECFDFAVTKNHSYIAMEPGLGKTPTAIVLINSFFDQNIIGEIMIVVPPFLITNWVRELSVWLVLKKDVYIYDKDTKDLPKNSIVIVPDSLIIKDHFSKFLKTYKKIDLLIVDEAHRFNNESKRTQAMYGSDSSLLRVRSFDSISFKSKRRVYLSGTPFDRPIGLYPYISANAFNTIEYRDRYSYGVKFCNGRMINFGRKKVFDCSGISCETEFKDKIKKFMIFKRLSDHTDLKGFTESIVTIDADMSNRNKIRKLDLKYIAKKDLKSILGSKINLGELATYRKDLALSKADCVTEYILDFLSGCDDSVIIFGIHKELLINLQTNLKKYKPLLINGDTKMIDRDKIEKDFMSKKSRVLLANIKTMVGLNLTIANKGFFVESDWTVSGNRQARDRMNRIGQDKFCTFEHLVMADSLDEYVLRKVLNQTESINRLLE